MDKILSKAQQIAKHKQIEARLLANIDEAMAKAQLRAKLQQIEDRFSDINEALLGLRELISMYLQETNHK